ncbi:MAG: transposase [Anaerolineae bacterium]|nr:transposase [Anaerolineae bacterium]
MTTFVSFVGVDIASASFWPVLEHSRKVTVKPTKFENDENGFVSFLGWLQEHNLNESTVVCMNTGAIVKAGTSKPVVMVAVEPPLNIQRKFPVNASKTDELDCQYIAESLRMRTNSPCGNREPRFWSKSSYC